MLANALCATEGFAQYIIFAIYILIIIAVAIVCRRKSASVNEFLFSKKGVGGSLTERLIFPPSCSWDTPANSAIISGCPLFG